MENQVTMHHTPQMQLARPHPIHREVQHRDANPVVSVLVVIGFVLISIATVVLTAHWERLGKNKQHEPAHNVPMVHLHQ